MATKSNEGRKDASFTREKLQGKKYYIWNCDMVALSRERVTGVYWY
jgi:hypothetical protein